MTPNQQESKHLINLKLEHEDFKDILILFRDSLSFTSPSVISLCLYLLLYMCVVVDVVGVFQLLTTCF